MDKSVVVPENSKGVLVTATFDPVPVAPPPPREVKRAAAPVLERSGPIARASSIMPALWKGVSLTFLGSGVIGLGIGSFYGFDTISKRNAAGCNSSDMCPSANAANELNMARRAGDVSTAFLVGGAGLVVTGAAVWMLAPRRSVRGDPPLSQCELLGLTARTQNQYQFRPLPDPARFTMFPFGNERLPFWLPTAGEVLVSESACCASPPVGSAKGRSEWALFVNARPEASASSNRTTSSDAPAAPSAL